VRTIADPVFDAVNELEVFESQGKISTPKLQQIRLKALPSPHLELLCLFIPRYALNMTHTEDKPHEGCRRESKYFGWYRPNSFESRPFSYVFNSPGTLPKSYE